MTNILLAGVGGQGTVLAAKLLATAAANKGWQVRTAETIGMAQRGGSVVSHVRMADGGGEVLAPLIPRGQADLIVAFEPGEAARALPYLSRHGLIVSAMTTVQPVTSALSGEPYSADDILRGIQTELYNGSVRSASARNHGLRQGRGHHPQLFNAELVCVDDAAALRRLGASRKMLNTVMLTAALSKGRVPLTVDDLREAIPHVIKEQHVAANLRATELL